MGTRNLTCVVHERTYKVAKYGQWDGYPDSLGIKILKFLLNDFEKESFIQNLNKVHFITDDELNALWKEEGSDDSGWANMEVSQRFKEKYYYLSRDCNGAEVLQGIQNSEVEKQTNSIKFAGNGLFCEWCYVVDLDKNTFEVYEGFNKTDLDPTERFCSFKIENEEYSSVKHLKTYSLNNLPTEEEFLKDLSSSDDENEEPLEEDGEEGYTDGDEDTKQ